MTNRLTDKSRQLKVDGKLSTKSNRSTAESLVMSMAVKSKESAAKALAMPCTCTSSTDTQCNLDEACNTGTQCDLDEACNTETQASTRAQTEDSSTESIIQTPPKADKATQTDLPPFGINDIKGDDHKTKFFTGLPSWEVFLHVFSLLYTFIPRQNGNTKLILQDEFLLVLMRLRLGLLFEDLAYRFNIVKSTASSISLIGSMSWLSI